MSYIDLLNVNLRNVLIKISKIIEPINRYAEKLNEFFDEVPSISKRISIIVSNLVAYTVVNGLILLIAIRASCKYPKLQVNPYDISAILIAMLFFFFINDVFTNHFPIKPKKNEKFTLKLVFIYICFALGSMLITWLYVASIYQPLISMPDSIFECTS
ncbi:hypothetical protein [Proteus sp. NMG38-2]|uniref:hypothetical protein n=1 Tax=Proteus sp. NMG38-2 TaxID=2883107 RepID=UPI001D0A7812|nr:hypothetical protein [Proteus sp. NMG38-2]UDN37410.1 hypothetical protein LG402_07135 [Proteus sp. NMG38-2]